MPDLLPDEPGGYTGFQGLFGHRYVAPQLGAGTPNLTHNGYQVTNAAGNLVDLNGNQINGAFLTNHPGFPGFGSINASQRLAYVADMQEAGVPVVNGYIADIHGNEHIPGLSGVQRRTGCARQRHRRATSRRRSTTTRPSARSSSGWPRTASPRPTRCSCSAPTRATTRQARTWAGRSSPPRLRRRDGRGRRDPDVRAPTRPGTFGELAGNLTGLLATQKNNTTPFSLEADTAPEFYVTGNPGPTSPRCARWSATSAGLTAANPYTGTTQKIANYLADPTEEAILHMVNADPARTPTFAMFAKPDYFLIHRRGQLLHGRA